MLFYLNPIIFSQLMFLRVINYMCVFLHGISMLFMGYVTLTLDNDPYKTEKSVFKMKLDDFTESEQSDVIKSLQNYLDSDELSKKNMLGKLIRTIEKIVENGEVSVGALATSISAISTCAHLFYIADPFYDRSVVYGWNTH